MAVIFVARSPSLGKWASDVGLSKHVYKVGCAEEPLKPLIEKGWAGETDWVLVKKEEIGGQGIEGPDEAAIVARLAVKEKMIDPNLYPRIKGTIGIFKVPPAHVENHILVSRALSGAPELGDLKLKPIDFAAYLIHNATR